MGINEIRNRSLSQNSLAKIQAMAAVSDPLVIADELQDAPGLSELELPVHLELKAESPEVPAVNDVAFYGPRVLEFYQYFLNKTALEGTAATLALACATLKSCVVIGQAITDAHSIKIPAIPAKATAHEIPGRKRGRPVGSKKKNA